jgi:hypothetical protein
LQDASGDAWAQAEDDLQAAMGDLQKAYDDAVAAFEGVGEEASDSGDDRPGEEAEKTPAEPVSSEASGESAAEEQ